MTKRAKKEGEENGKRALLRAALNAEAAARREVVRAHDEFHAIERMLPKPGSRWTKDPAWLAKHEPNYSWTYLFLVWHSDPRQGQLAVLETTTDEGEAHRRCVPMETFFEEYIAQRRTGTKT